MSWLLTGLDGFPELLWEFGGTYVILPQSGLDILIVQALNR
jgi:hypothetical protein